MNPTIEKRSVKVTSIKAIECLHPIPLIPLHQLENDTEWANQESEEVAGCEGFSSLGYEKRETRGLARLLTAVKEEILMMNGNK